MGVIPRATAAAAAASKQRGTPHGRAVGLVLCLMLTLVSRPDGRTVLVSCFTSVSCGVPRYTAIPSHEASDVFHLWRYDGDRSGSVGVFASASSSTNVNKDVVDDGTRPAGENGNRTGYRRIEDWHDETADPRHAIEHLKRERAKWAKAFEDLGGDGI
jgi:hypothetical protein